MKMTLPKHDGSLSGNRIFIGLLLTSLSATVSPRFAVPDEPGFVSLFDGKTLDGWEGNTNLFRVRSGAIVAGTQDSRIAHNEFLCTRDEFGDFELRLEARLVGEGRNAGIQFRSRRVPNHHEMIGYQCDIGEAAQRPIWGSLYDESRRRTFLAHGEERMVREKLQSGDWNQLIIRAEGKRIQIWLNGQQTVDYTESDADIEQAGLIGLQIHGGPPAEASYRRIRIKTLDEKP